MVPSLRRCTRSVVNRNALRNASLLGLGRPTLGPCRQRSSGGIDGSRRLRLYSRSAHTTVAWLSSSSVSYGSPSSIAISGPSTCAQKTSCYDSSLSFLGLPTPTGAEPTEIAGRIAARVEVILKKHGRAPESQPRLVLRPSNHGGWDAPPASVCVRLRLDDALANGLGGGVGGRRVWRRRVGGRSCRPWSGARRVDPTGGGRRGGAVLEGCKPDAGAPRWLAEGELLDTLVSVVCEDGTRLSPGDVHFDELPAGAEYDADSGHLRWEPGLDQAAVYDLTFSLHETNEPGTLRVGVADAFDHPDNLPIVDPLRYPFEYGLPVFFLEDPEHEEYHPSSLVYAGRRYPNVEVKLRGQTSRAYPKNSYTLKFPNRNLFQELDRGGGLTARKKVVLTTTFDDNAYVRQRLAHEMWGMLDPGHVAVKSYNAVVYRDGHYRGLYAVSDHINRHLMRQHGLSDAGELFKSMSHAGNFLNPNHGMVKDEGLPLEGEPGWDASLQNLITFVRDSDDTQFGEGLDRYVTVSDYQHWWIFAIFVGATDSAGKNSYHYLESPQATFRAIPWDFNASFGQNWRTERDLARGDLFERNGIWARMTRDPQLRDEMRQRFMAALHGPFALEAVLARFDQYVAEVAPCAERDWRHYGQAYRTFSGWARLRDDFTTPTEEADYVRRWVTERWEFLEGSFDALLSQGN